MTELADRFPRQNSRRWKTGLDTDIHEFCKKEGIPFYKYPSKDKGILNSIADILEEIYDKGKRTIKDVLEMTKVEFLGYGCFYGQRKKAEECWKTMNNILRRHGYSLYIKGRDIDY